MVGMKNWKTTLLGVLALLAQAFIEHQRAQAEKPAFSESTPIALMAAGLWMARDASGDSGK